MEKVTDGLKGLFDRIGAFFDLFDLSFFISGVTSLGALTFWGVRSNRWPLFELGGALKVIAAILASYVLGLVCFASGRLIRKAALRLVQQFTGSRNDIFKDSLEAHQLTSHPPFAGYLTWDKLPELYYRLWAEMRQTERFAPSLSFINRYWVMAATYDGVAVALLLWLGAVVALWAQGRLALSTTVAAAALLAVGFAACIFEGWRYVRYQIFEVVATFAHDVQRRGSLGSGAGAGGSRKRKGAFVDTTHSVVVYWADSPPPPPPPPT